MPQRAQWPVLVSFAMVLLALLASAAVGLQLFQDGSSYLLEILVSHAAVRHHRESALLIQAPSIVLALVLARAQVDAGAALAAVRLAFSLSYALVPLLALALSWLATRSRPGMLVWAALVILYVNLVNFSWVSELLIAVQLALPLLLALLLRPGSRLFWALAAPLLPALLLLHPLAAPLLAAMAALAAGAGWARPEARRQMWAGAAALGAAAIARAAISAVWLTPYEASFLDAQEASDYLFASSWQSGAFLASALLIGAACLGAGRARLSRRALAALYAACAVLAAAAGAVLVAQYLSGTRGFPLKVGVSLFVTVGVMAMAAADSLAHPSPAEERLRLRLAAGLAGVFCAVILAKSALWHASVSRLEETLAGSGRACLELDAAELGWLGRRPHTIISNWAIPSLALVVQDRAPRTLLVERGGCALFYGTGLVQIDPWQQVAQDALVPPLR